ncbi:MAG TPA: glycosyltransferase family 2 protein [Luteimonas sp.]|nr:glycosyltransferase family 2 protein [Luteimonas sp.]
MTTRTIFLVIPAYNEGDAIGDVVRTVARRFTRVVVVDDGSRDATASVALAAGAHVIAHPVNLGQGAALQTGLDYCVGQAADYIVTFDADGQHDPDDVDGMIATLEREGVQVALGSRFLAGASTNATRARRLLLKAAALFTRATTGLKVTDAHNGLRVLRLEAARRIRLRQNRMAHASEILEQIARMELTYVECPVTIRYTDYSRAKGQSGWDAIHILIDLALQRLKS